MPGSAGGDIESLSGADVVGSSLSLQSAAAFQDKMDEVVGFHIKSILIAGTALLDAAVVLRRLTAVRWIKRSLFPSITALPFSCIVDDSLLRLSCWVSQDFE